MFDRKLLGEIPAGLQRKLCYLLEIQHILAPKVVNQVR
jgi:hypothetical protein